MGYIFDVGVLSKQIKKHWANNDQHFTRGKIVPIKEMKGLCIQLNNYGELGECGDQP